MDEPATPATVQDLTPDPKNARTHPVRNLELIAASLREVGAARSIVIDEGDIVLAGNGVREAARLAGITKLRVIESSGDEIIAVRRRDLTAEQKTRLALFDNRSGELAEWNVDTLRELAGETNLSVMFTDLELSELLAQVPTFQPTPDDEQGKLDEKTPVVATCPQCGHVFEPDLPWKQGA